MNLDGLMSQDQLDRLNAIREGRGEQPTSARHRPEDIQRSSDLSPRELEVLEAMADGCTNLQVGQRISVTEHTAKSHVCRVYEKLGALNRAHAVALGFRTGLLKAT